MNDFGVSRMSKDIIAIAMTYLIYYIVVALKLKTITNQTDGNQVCLLPWLGIHILWRDVNFFQMQF